MAAFLFGPLAFRAVKRVKSPEKMRGTTKLRSLERIIARPRTASGNMVLKSKLNPPSMAPELPGRGMQETLVNSNPCSVITSNQLRAVRPKAL